MMLTAPLGFRIGVGVRVEHWKRVTPVVPALDPSTSAR
jgi:hypothetical protein